MKRKFYTLLVLVFFTACGGGKSSPDTSINESNNTGNTSTEIEETNTSTSNDTTEETSTDTSNETVEISDNENIDSNSTSIIENNTNSETEDNNNNDNDSESEVETETEIDTVVINQFGKAQLGVLSNATVKLYELHGYEKKLLVSTTTSTGNSIESIGNFNLYPEKLQNEKFYLYEVSGGEDYDVDDDGIIDSDPTLNKGTFHLLVLGRHIKILQQAQVTVISEILYQKLYNSLSLSTTELILEMQKLSLEIIQEDINDDGFIGIEDVLKYNPILHKKNLHVAYQKSSDKIVQDILDNQIFDITKPQFKESHSELSIHENLKLIKKIEILDDSTLDIILTGVDAEYFTYKSESQELFFKEEKDFETPQDSNVDNVYEVTIEATDAYFNINKKEFLIEVLNLNETVPQIPRLKDSNLSINENNGSNIYIGSILIENRGSPELTSFSISGEDALSFTISNEGIIFAKESFNYEEKKIYSFNVTAQNIVGVSDEIICRITIKDIPDIKPKVANISISVSENRPINAYIGSVNIVSKGDSNISKIQLNYSGNNLFKIETNGDIKTKTYLDYEYSTGYSYQYTATNQAGESEPANFNISINNIFENSGSDYPKTESGIQNALDNGDYSFVLRELLSNRDSYSGLEDDTLNTNIAAAYVGSSGYTVFDITSAMSEGNNSSFNDFVKNITQSNDSASSINQLTQADVYYSKITQGVDCTNNATLMDVEKDACFNLGLVRLTSLTNSVKLLFGGDTTTVEKWSNGVDVNSSDDLNGNGVLDTSEASACAIVYANNPNNSCQSSTTHSYRGGVTFSKNSKSYSFSLIQVDVGNAINGYQSFYQLISSNNSNNTPILTSGICDKNFNSTSQNADGVTYFPCPTLDDSAEAMNIKSSLENVANIQALFPAGDEVKTTIESYINNITGDVNGTIGLDNLSTYLRTH